MFRSFPRSFPQAILYALGLLAGGTQAQPLAAALDFDTLGERARALARTPWRATEKALPLALARIDYDGLRDIRYDPAQSLWRDRALDFEAQFFHLGLYQTQPVRIHEIAPGGTARPLPYRADAFDYGANRRQPQFRPEDWGDLGYAGLRIHYPLNTPAYKDELLVFLGASYFRALGAGQQYGLSARGLAIDTVGGAGEEFPRFTDFWLTRPAAGARSLTIYALLDAPRATGAYRFDIQPGAQTVTRVQARLFLRAGTRPIATLGIAPLTSMFFSGENQPRTDDFRPEVHDSDGLLIASGDGEWLWRPLQNPRRASVSSYALKKLDGFGLMQRDRAFASYEDTEARYERRPSAWVRPLGNWGPGRVQLLQLPTPDETHDNIVAWWSPERLPAPGEPLDLAYEIHWQGDAQQRPPGAWVLQTRRGMGHVTPAERAARALSQVQYVIDFTSPALDGLPADAPVRAIASSDANGRVLESHLHRHPEGSAHPGAWRLTLRVQRLDAARPVELRAFLQHREDTVSETWSHLLLPE